MYVAGRGDEGDIVTVLSATRIGLEVFCQDPVCTQFARPLYEQLRQGYDECAVLPLDVSVGEWRAEHRTARKRADRARRRGYTFGPIVRHERALEIQKINLSAPERQGKPMSAAYLQPVSTTPLPVYPCPRHGVHTYGVEDRDGTLVAYSWIYRSGDLALVSSILGHAAHLTSEVMYLLVQGIVAEETDGFLVYNRWDSGTDGLRFFKERLGFRPERVEWAEF